MIKTLLFYPALVLLTFAITNPSTASEKHKAHAHKHHHRFSNSKKWSKIFEDPTRDKWQKPELVLKRLNLKEDSKVADIGSATGYFPVRISKLVPKGRVWGIDIEPNLVKYLNERIQKHNLKNIFSTLGKTHDPLIPEKVNHIIIVDTYHHISNRVHYLRNLKSYLLKGAKITVVDFKKGKLPFGPSDKMKISHTEIIKEFKAAGFKLNKQYHDLPYQFILIFELHL